MKAKDRASARKAQAARARDNRRLKYDPDRIRAICASVKTHKEQPTPVFIFSQLAHTRWKFMDGPMKGKFANGNCYRWVNGVYREAM